MKTLIELRNEKAEVVEKISALLAKADEDKRDLTEEEETDYQTLDARSDELKTEIEERESADEVAKARREKIAKDKADLEKVVTSRGKILVGDDLRADKPWENFGEFANSVRNTASGVFDPRLAEARVQQMKNGTSGGYAIPDQFRDELLEVPPGSAVVRPKAFVIPAGDPPDAELSMPALDQSSSQNRFGGVTMYHQGESDEIIESTASLKLVTWKPKKITGYMTASNELMNNWGAASAVLPRLMRNAMSSQEDIDFLSGDGVNKSAGVFNSPAAVNYNRATANQISYADVLNMYSRLFTDGGGSPIWIANRTTIPQLGNIRDTGNNNIFIANAVPGIPNTLFGVPIEFTSRVPALGTKGDLALIDFSFYGIKDGSGPFLALSEHFRFQNDEVAFRITWHVDGQTWINEPIVQEGTTSTESPIVVLDTP